MPLSFDGAGTITGIQVGGLPDGIVDQDTLAANSVSNAKLATGTPNAAALPAGSILQVVQTVKTSQFTYGPATAFTDITGFNVSITPASADNKILVLVNLNVSTATSHHVSMKLLRDSTDIFIGDADGSRTRCTFHMRHYSGYDPQSYSGQFLDSPNTTSEVTYKMQIGSPYSNYSARVNSPYSSDNASYTGVTASTITAMEIAA